MSEHTSGPLKVSTDPELPGAVVVDSKGRMVCDANIFGPNLPLQEVDMGRARLLAAAYTSYDRHCGVNAVDCAEADLLGELLAVCKAMRDGLDDYWITTPEGLAIDERARTAIAKATKGTET